MATNDLLSQEEIDALLTGIGTGDVETEAGEVPDESENTLYDFTSQDRIVRGRMPALEMVNERFARNFRVSLFNLLRRNAEISVQGVQMIKFAEYMHTLYVPTSLNMVRIEPLRGSALFVLSPKLVFILVDNYFGGDGRYHAKIEGRDFTPMEQRIIGSTLDIVFSDLQKAWAPLLPIRFDLQRSEMNPQFANVVSASEVVVVNSFHVELDGGGGELHIMMPYSMLEPIRELLDAHLQGERGEVDQRWNKALRDEVFGAKVEVVSQLTEIDLTLGEVLSLKEGDVLPFDMSDHVILNAEGMPTYRCQYGAANGNKALQVEELVTVESKQTK